MRAGNGDHLEAKIGTGLVVVVLGVALDAGERFRRAALGPDDGDALLDEVFQEDVHQGKRGFGTRDASQSRLLNRREMLAE